MYQVHKETHKSYSCWHSWHSKSQVFKAYEWRRKWWLQEDDEYGNDKIVSTPQIKENK